MTVIAQIVGIGIWFIVITPKCESTNEPVKMIYDRPEECKQDVYTYRKQFPMYDFQCVQEKET